MVSDTNMQLKLARELNAEMGAAHPGALTRAQLKKVSEIEKLARRVRAKMGFQS